MDLSRSDVWTGAQSWTLSPLRQAEEQDLSTFAEADVKELSSHQVVEFLSVLLQEVRSSGRPPGVLRAS